MSPIHRLKPLITRLGLAWAIATRAMTLGVRGLVIDPDGRVLLVRHTYLPGWYLPGGGVDPGETLGEAVVREIAEETGVVVAETPRLVSMYLNRRASRRDHVAFFVVRLADRLDAAALRGPAHEIAEVGVFSRDRLPEGVTAATRRRLAEVFDGLPAAAEW